MPELHVLSTEEDVFEEAARFVADVAQHCSDTQGRFTIALSGGSTPRRLYRLLATSPIADAMAWDRWHIFWGDERCVPPDHEDSNYRMARETLLSHIPVPDNQVHRMRGEDVPHEAAEEYETLVRDVFQAAAPSFDLILLGIGDDGHTASLFPNSRALEEQDRLIVANWAPSLQAYRITFTLPLINAARTIAFLDIDESKAAVLRSVLDPRLGEDQPPAASVRSSMGSVHWFLTDNAAKLLTKSTLG